VEEERHVMESAAKANEKVEDYIARARKLAKRLDMEAPTVCDAILHGLKPALRMFMLQQAPTDLDSLVKAAKVAEAVASPSSDALATALLDSVKALVLANDKQTAEINELTARVAALTTVPFAQEAYQREVGVYAAGMRSAAGMQSRSSHRRDDLV
jgi:hypothetical protein